MILRTLEAMAAGTHHDDELAALPAVAAYLDTRSGAERAKLLDGTVLDDALDLLGQRFDARRADRVALLDIDPEALNGAEASRVIDELKSLF